MWRSVGLTGEVGRWRGERKRWLISVLRQRRDPVAKGGQRDPATTGEREESEGPTGQWKAATEATLTRVGEDGAGTTEMPSMAPHSGACGWVRRQGKRGCCSCGRVRERTGKKEGAGAAAGAF
jgi:hypothetical protein